jgi:uncharacterized membrane protein (DUF2068 family)
MGTKQHRDIGFMAIAALKIVKGVLLLLVGIGALSLIHKDAAESFTKWANDWANALQVNVHSRVLQRWLVEIGLVQRRDLALIVTVSFVYSALLLTEGVGLFMQKVWAEYMTALITASFIPIEVYELVRRTTPSRVYLLVINIVVVAYLVMRLSQRKRAEA